MTTLEDIQHQRKLLKTLRDRVRVQLRQHKAMGVLTPAYIVTEIEQGQQDIATIKAWLTAHGETVEDAAEDSDGSSQPPGANAPSVSQHSQNTSVPVSQSVPAASGAHTPPTIPPTRQRRDIHWLAAIATIVAVFIGLAAWLWPDPFRFGAGSLSLPSPTSVTSASLPPQAVPTATAVMPETPIAQLPLPASQVPTRDAIVEITFTALTIHSIPQPEPLDKAESPEAGDFTVNFNVAGEERRWPKEPSTKHIKAGDTAPISEVFRRVVPAGESITIAAEVLEMDPETLNENDSLFRNSTLIDPNNGTTQQGILRDTVNGSAEVLYTVIIKPVQP